MVLALNESAYGLTQASQRQLDNLLWAAFQTGDELQRDAVDLFFDVVTLRAFAPQYVARLTRGVAEQSVETGSTWLSGSGRRLAWQELKNKYAVYGLVKSVGELLHVPEGRDFPLGALVEKAYAQGAYGDLWLIEGLGHDYAKAYWKPPERIHDLMSGERARAVPESSLTMLHAGIGLAFAERLLAQLTPYTPAAETQRLLGEFIALCRQNSREGYTGAAYESLGLVARTWHPQLMGLIDRALGETAPEVSGYFWHGAGRALYFLPVHFVPGSPSPVRAAEREAPHEAARRNLLAGLAWAMTLVNIRQPGIMVQRLTAPGSAWTRGAEFANGMLSSLIMASDITPGDLYVREFCAYRPDSPEAELAQRWHDLVSRACREALGRYSSVLKRNRRLEAIFQYQSLEDLVAQLERERPAGPGRIA